MMVNYRTKKGREFLELKIKEYFELCDKKNAEDEKEKKSVKPYTLTVLLYHLDMSADELEELSKSRKLSRTIGSAKRKIEAYIEENALNGRLSPTAAINSLKEHFGWNEKNGGIMYDRLSVELSDEVKELGA